MNKYYDKKGMSMGEVLIAMAILGVLVILLMPSLRGAQPDKNEVLHNKATHIVDTIFTDIKTDPRLYSNSFLGDIRNVKYNGKEYGGTTKFCELFASRLNLKSGSEINCKADEKTLTTVEGIDWYLPVTNFTGGNSKIMIDVNGDKEPNCLGTAENCSKPDRFEYFLQQGIKISENSCTVKKGDLAYEILGIMDWYTATAKCSRIPDKDELSDFLKSLNDDDREALQGCEYSVNNFWVYRDEAPEKHDRVTYVDLYGYTSDIGDWSEDEILGVICPVTPSP